MEHIQNNKFKKLEKEQLQIIKGGVYDASSYGSIESIVEEYDITTNEYGITYSRLRKKVSRGQSTSTGWYYVDVCLYRKGELFIRDEHWFPVKV